MHWLVFAGAAALFESLSDLFSKRGLGHYDEYVVAWSMRFFALPILLPLLFFIDIPSVDATFVAVLAISGGLNVIATILYVRAIKSSDLSVTAPMVSFTPLFMLATSPLIIGEFPGPLGLAGIILIIAGAYTLQIQARHQGFLAPFKALLAQKGPRLMLGVAFLWSITANVDKVGVLATSPLFWAVTVDAVIALGLFPVMLYFSKGHVRQIPKGLMKLVPVGIFSGLVLAVQMAAIALTLAAYVIAVKRGSTVLSVFWGHLFFKETGLKERAAGAAIMVAGVALIALS